MMEVYFVLRRVFNNIQQNTVLGGEYTLYRRGTEVFQDQAKVRGYADTVYAFIDSPYQGDIPLVECEDYFIMLGNGQTFENLSFIKNRSIDAS